MPNGNVWHRHFERVRDGVKPALGERPAAAQPLRGQDESTACPMLCDGLIRIVRTGRMKLASAAEKRPEKSLIATEQRKQ